MNYLNLLGRSCFYKNPSTIDLLIFTIISLVLVGFLLAYYNKIDSRRNQASKQVAIPIYNSKDNFSQEIIGDSNFILAEKSTSIFTKITVYVLAIVILTSSMSKILTNGAIDYLLVSNLVKTMHFSAFRFSF